MIATLNNAATTTLPSALAASLESLFAGLEENSTDAAQTDLVIDEWDQWRNPVHSVAGYTQTFNLVVVATESITESATVSVEELTRR